MPTGGGVSATDTTVAVRDEYERLAKHYDKRWSRYVTASGQATLARAAVLPGEHVLDVGCGTGALLELLELRQPAASLFGADLAPGMIAAARERLPATVPLVVADAMRLPVANGSFDVVISNSSFHYWPDPAQALTEIARVLRPDGRVVITDWCADYLSCRLCDIALRLVNRVHRGALRSKALRQLLERSRFSVTALDRYKIDWLWGLMTAVAHPSSRIAADMEPSPLHAGRPLERVRDGAPPPGLLPRESKQGPADW